MFGKSCKFYIEEESQYVFTQPLHHGTQGQFLNGVMFYLVFDLIACQPL